ncbi:MAG: hypothetical protein IID61_09775 [SAR324 cluster bacterium]|nr:hypothetical protein [SAR324 cluster bacterium]
MENARDSLHVTVAPSVRDPQKKVLLYTNAETLRGFANFVFSSKIAQYLGLVRGGLDSRVPGICTASAVFKGLKRDQIEPGYDANIYAYVATPEIGFALGNEARKNGMGPIPIEKTRDSVFVTYVLLAKDREVYFHGEFKNSLRNEIVGQILDWEWVRRSPTNHNLPDNWQTRYEEEKWII